MGLQESIDHWRKLGQDERARPSWDKYALQKICDDRANLYERTAQALETKRDTGVAVCSCCHKPLGDARPYWMRGASS